jgi:hypothetical protein
MGKKPRERGASAFIDASRYRPDPDVVRLRLQERDQRLAADNRSENGCLAIRRLIGRRWPTMACASEILPFGAFNSSA